MFCILVVFMISSLLPIFKPCVRRTSRLLTWSILPLRHLKLLHQASIHGHFTICKLHVCGFRSLLPLLMLLYPEVSHFILVLFLLALL